MATKQNRQPQIRLAETRMLPLSLLAPNDGQIDGLPANPRDMVEKDFRKLKKSITDNPEMLALRELLVYPHDADNNYVVIGGNMRLMAMHELGYEAAPCKVLPPDTTVEQMRAYVIKDNVGYGQWNWDMLANEWDSNLLDEWGLQTTWEMSEEKAEIQGAEMDEAEIERKRQEFKDRMEAGELDEDDPEYQEFLKKFELKKTTDDCYTPEVVYEAVAEWVANEYKLNRKNFKRPFYPGGDYQNETYLPEDVVVDNPPFSIMAEILDFYGSHGIRFFLFGPHLTLFSSSCGRRCTALPVGVTVTYENGANVGTSFLTNLEPDNIRFRSEPRLHKAVNDANKENLRNIRKELPRYFYDKHVVIASFLATLSRLGIDYAASVEETEIIDELDAQKASGKAVYGKGFLISDRLVAEREKAEREKAEREKAEREKAEREKAEREKAEREKAEREKADKWVLSERECQIIEKLNNRGGA